MDDYLPVVLQVWDDGTPPEIAAMAVPTFCGYSASGNVTATLVYANYGRREDYDYLVSQGVDLTYDSSSPARLVPLPRLFTHFSASAA
jgi:hypothetical protein